LLEDNMPIFETPPVLFTSMRSEWSETVKKEITKRKEIHVDIFLKELHYLQRLPVKEDLMNVVSKENPHNWDAQFVHDNNTQTLESYNEQKTVIDAIRASIQRYVLGSRGFTKSIIINGPPGAGKTFIMMVASLLALCKGLTVTPTALMAERASTLGGTYIHRLFCIPPNNYTPQRLAEVAINRILRRPVVLQYLLILDVLGWDEAGQNPAQLLATCDIIMRKLRGSDLFFGGVLLLCTLDHLQLRPIKGLPFLLSPHIVTCFEMVQLKHLVRSSQDPPLQQIIDICRMSKQDYNSAVIAELKTLMTENCTWVDSWDSKDIPKNATRCFGMRNPAQKAEARYVEQVRQDCARSGAPFLTVQATDLQQPQQSHAPWSPASFSVTKQLHRRVKEPEILAFFKFAAYEFTFNELGKFAQTQLAVLCDVPAQVTIDHFRPVPVLCAPNGTKYIDFEILSRAQLLEKGWTEQNAIPAPQHTQTLRAGLKARRQQYGLRPHVSNTFHGAMGATLCKLATEINVKGSGNQLWEKGQVVVMVSRTKFAKDLIFVGNRARTLEIICDLIQVQSQYDDFINHILEVLANRHVHGTELEIPRVVEERCHFLRPNDIPLPEAFNGCCYLLVSTKNLHVTYIGQTMRALATRLNEHNSGKGSEQTKSPTLIPWGLLAFVTGFNGDRVALRCFEEVWEEKRLTLFRRQTGEITAQQIISEGTNLMSSDPFHTMGLRIVVKGTIVEHSGI
jgi:predicted GIY-YIG superfamily endonuclease